jgi:hypothetical protein
MLIRKQMLHYQSDMAVQTQFGFLHPGILVDLTQHWWISTTLQD